MAPAPVNKPLIRPRPASAPDISKPSDRLNVSKTGRVPLIDTKDQPHKLALRKPVSPAARAEREKSLNLKPVSPAPAVFKDQHVKISIKAPKAVFETPLKETYHFEVGAVAKIKTEVSNAIISPIFKWYCNGVQIQQSEKIQILVEKHVSTLVINNTQEDDSANYDCTVVTAKGKQLLKSSCVINIGSK